MKTGKNIFFILHVKIISSFLFLRRIYKQSTSAINKQRFVHLSIYLLKNKHKLLLK